MYNSSVSDINNNQNPPTTDNKRGSLHIIPPALEKIKETSEQLELVGHLQFGDRLLAKNGKITGKKVSLSKDTNRFLRLIRLAIQVIHRLITGQTTEKGLHTLNNLLDQLKKDLNTIEWGQITDESEKAILLNALNLLKQNLQDEGLENLQETVSKGKDSFFCLTPCEKRRRKELMSKIQNSRLYLMGGGPISKGENATIAEGLINQKMELLAPDPNKRISSQAQVEELITDLLHSKGQKIHTNKYVRYSTNEVEHVLSEIYGKTVTKDVLKMYQLDTQPFMSQMETRALLVGIVSNLTVDDVKGIIQNPSNLLPEELQNKLSKAKGEELTDSALLSLVEQLRDIQIPSQELFPTFKKQAKLAIQEVFFGASWLEGNTKLVGPHSSLNAAQYQADFARLVAFKRTKNYQEYPHKDIQPFNGPEYLARDVAYVLFNAKEASFRKGILVPMFDASRPDGSAMTMKQAHPIIAKPGLYAAGLVAALPENETTKDLTVDVVFRGTYCTDSVHRDLSSKEKASNHRFEGPGRKSFQENQKEILKNINLFCQKYSDKTQKEIHLRGSGHSLGATDIQRAIAFLAKNSLPFALASVELHGFNPPKVEKDVTNQFLKDIQKTPKIQYDFYYYKANKDFVQMAGHTLLGGSTYDKKTKKVTKPDNLSTTVFQFSHPKAPTTTLVQNGLAHTIYMMTDIDTYNTYLDEVYTNDGKIAGKVKKGKQHDMDVELEPKLAAFALFISYVKRKKKKDDSQTA